MFYSKDDCLLISFSLGRRALLVKPILSEILLLPLVQSEMLPLILVGRAMGSCDRVFSRYIRNPFAIPVW